MATPFVKWAGGKRQLLDVLVSNLPDEFGAIGGRCYAEPFVGGGAMLFRMFELDLVDKALINDHNPDLILTYRTIKYDVEALIEVLKELNTSYNQKNHDERRAMYFEQRTAYNTARIDVDYDANKGSNPVRAAQFIFLNKTGFNGLHRVNRKGDFNVPPSNLATKDFTQADNLRAVHGVLQHVSIHCGDYQEALSSLKEGWFTYFDPPYRPLTQTSFTTYGAMDWSDDTQQIRLANFAKGLQEKGLKFMISNSDPASVDETDLFFPEQFPSPTYRILSIRAIRAINSNGKDRGAVGELLITNYKLEEES